MSHLYRYDTVFFDLDGTVWHNFDMIEGACDVIRSLQKKGIRVVVVSNRGTHSRREIAERFQQEGVGIPEEHVLVTSFLAASFLAKEKATVWLLGEKGLEEEMERADVPIAKQPENADWLVTSLHTGVTYEELDAAFQCVKHGARIIATNVDPVYTSGNGVKSLDAGALLAAVERASGKQVEIIVGKPSIYMNRMMEPLLVSSVERALFVGDSLTSDMPMAEQAGMTSVLVLTGNTSKEDLGDLRAMPDIVLPSVKELEEACFSDKYKEGKVGSHENYSQ